MVRDDKLNLTSSVLSLMVGWILIELIYHKMKLAHQYHMFRIHCHSISNLLLQILSILVETLHWRHNGHSGISNHQPHDCLLNRFIGRTASLLKPPQSPHCYLGAVDHAKNFPPPLATCQAWSYHANRATQTLLFSSPLILLRCVMEIKFAQNLRWLGNWH